MARLTSTVAILMLSVVVGGMLGAILFLLEDSRRVTLFRIPDLPARGWAI